MVVYGLGEIESMRKRELMNFLGTGDVPVEVQTAIMEFTGSLVLRSQRVCRNCGEAMKFDITEAEAVEIISRLEKELEHVPSGNRGKKKRQKLRSKIRALEEAVYCMV